MTTPSRNYPPSVRAFRAAAALLGCAMLATLLQGCPPNPLLHPAITVTRAGNVLIVSGTGFAGVPACARLSLQSPATGSRLIGTPSCSSGGTFSDFAYPYSYAGCANPTSTTSVTVFAVDTQGSNAGTSQTVQIPWGPYCSLQAANCIGTGAACQACGGEGEPVCSGNSCVQPAEEGSPVCSNGVCPAGQTEETCSYESQVSGICNNDYPDLHPALSNPNDVNSQLICTANCGHTRGYSPCYPYMNGCYAGSGVTYPATIIAEQDACYSGASSTYGLAQWTCYDNSVIEAGGTVSGGECTCQPSQGICPRNQSPGNGVCAPSKTCN